MRVWLRPFTRLLALLLTLSWIGCIDVTFDQPQPPQRWDRKQIPRAWTGTWIPADVDGEVEEQDVITITQNSITGNLFDESVELTLETMHVRWFRGHLVFSTPVEEKTNAYRVFLAQRHQNQMTVYSFSAEVEKVAIWQDALGAEIQKTTGADGSVKAIHMAPANNAAFKALMQQGGLTQEGTLVRAGAETP